MIKQIETIINNANEKENFQEACYYIVSEIEKITKDWDLQQKIINHIEQIYDVNIIY